MWIGPKATAISEIAVAQQWVRLPAMFNLAWNMPLVNKSDPGCASGRLGKDIAQTTGFEASIYMVAVDAAAPQPFGYVGPFTVRTAAFGSIPVEATVIIRQPRDGTGSIAGYQLKQTASKYCAGKGPHARDSQQENYFPPVSIDAPIELSITQLKVDGIDLQLRGNCRPQDRTTMKLTSRGYFDLDPTLKPEDLPVNSFMTTPFFAAPAGGLLQASIDISPFTGCTTNSGEDVSQLLTATVSGPHNGVEMRTEGLKSGGLRCAQDRSQCTDPLAALPLPSRNGS